jgi:enoyl-CoA hydratase/carnithine racemase
MTNYCEIRYDVAKHIATITFNRPEQRNALSPVMLDELAAAVRAAHTDDAVRVSWSPGPAARSAPGVM